MIWYIITIALFVIGFSFACFSKNRLEQLTFMAGFLAVGLLVSTVIQPVLGIFLREDEVISSCDLSPVKDNLYVVREPNGLRYLCEEVDLSGAVIYE